MVVPSGKRLLNGKSPCSMGKSTISMAMFNSYVKLPEGIMVISCGTPIEHSPNITINLMASQCRKQLP